MRLIFILILLCMGSCKAQQTGGQEEKKQDTSKPVVRTPKFEDLYDQEAQLSPGTVRIDALLQGDSAAGELCGIPIKNTVSIAVQQLKGSGSSIVNPPYPKQKMVVEVASYMADKMEGKGKQMTLLLKEMLCRDMSQTYYQVIGF